MTPVVFSPRARLDLLDIGDHIAKDSMTNAHRFVGKLIAQCERIGRAPMGYASREELAPGLRMAALDRYVIFFRILEEDVRIERVLHGARNLPFIFGDGSGKP